MMMIGNEQEPNSFKPHLLVFDVFVNLIINCKQTLSSAIITNEKMVVYPCSFLAYKKDLLL